MHHRTLQAIINLRTGKGDPLIGAAYLRNEAAFPDQCAALYALEIQEAKYLDFATGTIIANAWSNVWTPLRSKEIPKGQKAINWNLALFTCYSKMLASHVSHRDVLVKSFMHGNFEEATIQLTEHIRLFGHTLWSARWNLVIAEEIGGTGAREGLRDTFRAQQGERGVAFFSDIFNVAADKSVTEDRYRALVRSSITDAEVKSFLELLFLDELHANCDILKALRWMEWLPLIDRYELFVKLAGFAVALEHADAARFSKALIKLAVAVADPITQYAAECVADDSSNMCPFQGASIFGAWDYYLASKYTEAINAATKTAHSNPWLFGAHELIVKSAMYLGSKVKNRPRTPYAELQFHLFNLFSKNSDAEDSLAALRRLGTRLGIPPLTFGLRSLNAQHSSPSSNQKWNRVAAYLGGVHSPRNFEHPYHGRLNLMYLEKCIKSYPNCVSAHFFRELAAGLSIDEIIGCESLPLIRKTFFGGIAAAKHGRYSEAIQRLAAFEKLQGKDSENPLSPFAMEEARRTLVDVYRLKGDVEQLQRLIVASFMQRPQSVRRLPIQDAFATCSERRNEASKHVEFPIIAYLAVSDPHQVSLCLKRFLRYRGVAVPSQLISQNDIDQHVLGVLFLRVCTADILDSLDELDTVQKVDGERLHLLEWIKGNLQDIANAAKTEILSVTQNAELRDALENLDEAKVVLDVPGLRNAEKEKFNEAYNRFQAQKELGLSRRADMIVNALMDMRAGVLQPKLFLPNSSEHAIDVFAGAFREIRDAFLSSPYYGLEACLSGQVRHGIIVQHIRNPFLEKRVAVKASGMERQDFERHWRPVFSAACRQEHIDACITALAEMTRNVDTIAQEVKEKWIQSKTEIEGSVGLFDFTFDDDQIQSMYHSFDFGDASSDTFLDNVFDILLKRTREGLKVVRQRINVELRKRLGETVDTAISKISALDHSVVNPLRHALTVCRQEVESVVCAQMIRWFQESKTSLMGNSDFQLIARTSVGMIERLNPNLRGRFSVEIDSEFRVRGRHFRAVVLLIFFLLDNAVQHSKVSDNVFQASLHVTAKANRLSICVKAKMSCPDDARLAEKNIKERVDQHKRDFVPEKVIREGGSGLAKVIATVVYEFGQVNPDIQASCDGSDLSVTIISQMEGVAV